MSARRSGLLAAGKLMKPHFWFSWLTLFVFGYVASAGSDFRHVPWALVTGIGICVAFAVCNIHNALVDREEDSINQPERVALLVDVGERRLWAMAAAGYAANGVGIILTAAIAGIDVAAWFAVAGASSVAYNAGPRLKRRPMLAELSMAVAASSMFLAGWTWHEPATSLPAAGVLVAVFIGMTGFLKDVADVAGDTAVGAPALFNLPSRAVRYAALGAIAAGPYCLLAVVVASGLAPSRLLTMLWLLPVGILLGAAAANAGNERATIGTYHFSFLYVHLFCLSLFVLQVFTATAFLLAATLLGGRLLAMWLRLDPRLAEPDPSWADLATETWAAARRRFPTNTARQREAARP